MLLTTKGKGEKTMQNRVRIMLIVALLTALLFSVPMPAYGAETTEYPYEAAVAELREAMVLRESPVVVQVDCMDEEFAASDLFFAAVEHNGTPVEGDYLQQHIKSVKVKTETETVGDGFRHIITYEITYRTDLAQEEAVVAKVKEILDQLDVYDASDYEKVAAVYNYLCSHVHLDNIVHLTGATTVYTAYGALVQNSAVCQGYASAFYRLMLELQVDNRFISGSVGTVPHGWNIVALDGVYYNVDATKDAGFSFGEYRHFLKKDLPTHTRDSKLDTTEFHTQYPMATKNHVHSHYWNAGEITLTANGYREGERTYTCTICKATDTEPIPRQGWALIDGKWYCYKEGLLETGWKVSNNICYYLNKSGVMQTGWVKIDGRWYLFDRNGAMQTGWKKSGSIWYYLNDEGIMQTGWKKISGVWYYFSPDGAMQIGWQKIGTVWYYLNPSGAMQTGWRKVGDTWYYFDSSGAMKTGWQKIGGIWYYFRTSGAMATGSVKIGATTYKFRASGSWIS